MLLSEVAEPHVTLLADPSYAPPQKGGLRLGLPRN